MRHTGLPLAHATRPSSAPRDAPTRLPLTHCYPPLAPARLAWLAAASRAAQDGGGTWENARPGFSAGYMSVADPDVLLNAQRRINEPSIPVPKEPPGMKWKKIEGTPGPQSLEEAEWLQQAKEWRSGGQNTAEEDEERRAAAEERRQEAGRRAEEEWRRQQRANEASAAEARRQATRAEDEDLELQIALAVSASAASGDLNAQLRAELDLEEHRKAAGAQGEVGGRSRGQALAARYWISCCLGEDEELTADADGFYDLWGDYTEAEELEQGRCPTLRALLELDGGAPELRREALLVDRRSDIVLAELCETVKASLAGNEGKPLEVRAVYLAKTVARIMGGEAAPEQLPELQARWEAAASELRANGKGCARRDDVVQRRRREAASPPQAAAPARLLPLAPGRTPSRPHCAAEASCASGSCPSASSGTARCSSKPSLRAWGSSAR